MIRELSTTNTTVDRHYDLCIIGSGPAGISVLDTVMNQESDADVCVLESGGVERTAFGDRLRDVKSDGLDIKPESRERTVGGASTTWAGLSTLFDPTTFLGRGSFDESSWPNERSNLVRYYRKASRRYGFPPVDLFEKPRPGLSRSLGFETPDWNELEERLFLRPDENPDFRGLLLEMAESDQCDLFVQSTVTQLTGDSGSNEVRRVSVRDFDGRHHTFSARVFVLAAGGIENPRILLNSTFSCESGLGNEADQVGRYFMNHPKGNYGTIEVSNPAVDVPYTLGSLSFDGGFTGYLGLQPSPEAQREHDVVRSYIRFHPIYPWAWRRRLRNLRERRVSNVFTSLPDVARSVPRSASMLYERMRTGSTNARLYGIRNFVEMEPRPNNRVVLSDETDVFGVPKAEVRYSLSAGDRRCMSAVHSLLDEELRRSDWGDTARLLHDDVEPWPTTEDASHHMGTTRMGTDDSTSVVDANCRIHSCPNVYVAGSSVFPTGDSGNPTWTIVALSIRLGEHLCADIP